ncbi:MAG: hypothetical protein KAT27_07695, partial [Desulfobacterales bacterium]|nr:hypothetical protein [Desulfobacterales bacterium]
RLRKEIPILSSYPKKHKTPLFYEKLGLDIQFMASLLGRVKNDKCQIWHGGYQQGRCLSRILKGNRLFYYSKQLEQKLPAKGQKFDTFGASEANVSKFANPDASRKKSLSV